MVAVRGWNKHPAGGVITNLGGESVKKKKKTVLFLTSQRADFQEGQFNDNIFVNVFCELRDLYNQVLLRLF